MGEPILEGPKVPTTLTPTQGTTVVEGPLEVDGRSWAMTCVSMGNPHAITYSVDGQPIKVRGLCVCVWGGGVMEGVFVDRWGVCRREKPK